MPGIQPRNLTDRELVRYAELMNNNGLPKEWADELIKRFEKTWEDRNPPQSERKFKYTPR